jgi:serine/threonine-protein kinase HipA
MKYCPITYEEIAPNQYYSQRGLRLLSPQLTDLNPLEFSADELNNEALARAGKMSIQGVQPKLSAQLKIKHSCFEIVDQKGHYILKPQSKSYAELPENEAITMTLAAVIGLDVPVHGLVYGKDNKMTYFIKRFDRTGHNGKVAIEDFAQLSGLSRDTKYRSSMEKVINIIEQYCSFPKIEFVKLFKLALFSFLTGNEDMHLKNFSLITKKNLITLSPAYDLLNTTIALPRAEEELALPLNGKKNNLRKNDFINYFAEEKLKLNRTVINDVMLEMKDAIPMWNDLLSKSFLSIPMREKYFILLESRSQRLGLI